MLDFPTLPANPPSRFFVPSRFPTGSALYARAPSPEQVLPQAGVPGSIAEPTPQEIFDAAVVLMLGGSLPLGFDPARPVGRIGVAPAVDLLNRAARTIRSDLIALTDGNYKTPGAKEHVWLITERMFDKENVCKSFVATAELRHVLLP
jgi:hypothetical protein